jgi:EAL domain-containing protein (putative c-di-GMP-specific phosphodiesterase class I)
MNPGVVCIDVSVVHDMLQAAGVPERSLALEVTQTTLMADDQAATRLDDLRDMGGMRVSLDNFGTGASSLTYVRMFHADTIKIDRDLVSLLPDDAEARAIVMSTIPRWARATVRRKSQSRRAGRLREDG